MNTFFHYLLLFECWAFNHEMECERHKFYAAEGEWYSTD